MEAEHQQRMEAELKARIRELEHQLKVATENLAHYYSEVMLFRAIYAVSRTDSYDDFQSIH